MVGGYLLLMAAVILYYYLVARVAGPSSRAHSPGARC
jgi:hypothetical protein